MALEIAVRSGSVARVNHLLDAGASVQRSRALAIACEENATLMAHKLLSSCPKAEDVARFGPVLVESAAKRANPELASLLLSRGAIPSNAALRMALAAEGAAEEDVLRLLVVLLRRGGIGGPDNSDPRVEVAKRVLNDTRPAFLEGMEAQHAVLLGHEPAFVADKPVPQPKSFHVDLRSGRASVTIGRSDPAAGHHVDVDLGDVFSAASVSRTHALLRFHDSRQVWQIRVCGRNGIFDERGRFFPPQPEDEWTDLAVFPNNKFEIGWVKFELKPVH